MRKLSDIKGRESMLVLAQLITPIANIVSDPDVMAMFRPDKPAPKGKDQQAYAMQLMAKGFPPLMERHGDDFIRILSIIDGVTFEEYEEQMTLQGIINDFGTLINDEAFRAFLLP